MLDGVLHLFLELKEPFFDLPFMGPWVDGVDEFNNFTSLTLDCCDDVFPAIGRVFDSLVIEFNLIDALEAFLQVLLYLSRLLRFTQNHNQILI